MTKHEKYNRSEKGRARTARYRATAKGQATQTRWQNSASGIVSRTLAHVNYNASRRGA